jgi:hypothetical protein
MRVRESFSTLLMAAICAAFAGGASLQAATVSNSSPIPASDGAGHGGLPTTAPFTLQEFNPALGTLLSVHVDFALSYQGENDIFNFSGSTQTFTNASSTVPINITAPSPSVPSVSASNLVSSGSLPIVSNSFLGTVLNTTVPFDALPADLPSYIGGGLNSYLLSYGSGTYSGSTGAPGGTVFFGGDANSVGTATVTYTYTPVPEPSTLALLGLGVMGFAAAIRRSAQSRRV